MKSSVLLTSSLGLVVPLAGAAAQGSPWQPIYDSSLPTHASAVTAERAATAGLFWADSEAGTLNHSRIWAQHHRTFSQIQASTRQVLRAAEVDGDGAEDWISVVWNAGGTGPVNVAIARGPDFMESQIMQTNLTLATDVAVGDLDGDGAAEIVIGSGHEAKVVVIDGATSQEVQCWSRQPFTSLFGIRVAIVERWGTPHVAIADVGSLAGWIGVFPLTAQVAALNIYGTDGDELGGGRLMGEGNILHTCSELADRNGEDSGLYQSYELGRFATVKHTIVGDPGQGLGSDFGILGDGRIAISATEPDKRGGIYVYDRKGTAPVLDSQIPGTIPNEYFGCPFSVGDVDGDGRDEVVAMENLLIGPGRFRIFGEGPLKLAFDSHEISTSTGGTITATVNLGAALAGRPALLFDALDVDGGGGTLVHGANILLDSTLFPSMLTPNLLVLDSNGQGSASLTLPPLPPALQGIGIVTQGVAAGADALVATGLAGFELSK